MEKFENLQDNQENEIKKNRQKEFVKENLTEISIPDLSPNDRVSITFNEDGAESKAVIRYSKSGNEWIFIDLSSGKKMPFAGLKPTETENAVLKVGEPLSFLTRVEGNGKTSAVQINSGLITKIGIYRNQDSEINEALEEGNENTSIADKLKSFIRNPKE